MGCGRGWDAAGLSRQAVQRVGSCAGQVCAALTLSFAKASAPFSRSIFAAYSVWWWELHARCSGVEAP